MISEALKEAFGEEAPIMIAQIIGGIFMIIITLFVAVIV